jgi:hypothetical protein
LTLARGTLAGISLTAEHANIAQPYSAVKLEGFCVVVAVITTHSHVVRVAAWVGCGSVF